MSKGPSFTGRIILAFLLMVGFYFLAISIAMGLILIPVVQVLATDHIHLKIALLCLFIGGMILWSVMPRFDRFVPPGPLITASEQPELFAEIEEIATATKQSMPKAVYAIPEMNAWVANRGGVMGLGSRRIMGLGVPLMQVLTKQQFRGVLAHEFGHYDAGDTSLGPWIFVTRSAIIRTVINLAQQGSTIVRKPFEWYLKMFLSLTQKVSRQQEFNADALASRIVGPEAMASGLKAVHANALAFDSFWQNEYVPVLSSGYYAPISRGFQTFYSSPKIQHALQDLIDDELKNGKSDIYDSHPSLKDRIAGIEATPGPRLPPDDPPFIEVIRNLDQLEKKMIEHLTEQVKEKIPEAISWENVAERVWIPYWRKTVAEIAKPIAGLKLGQATEFLGDPQKVANLIAPATLSQLPSMEEVTKVGMTITSMVTALALAREGWEIRAPIGAPVVARKGEIQIEPFESFNQLSSGLKSVSEMIQIWKESGICDMVLWPEASPCPTEKRS